MNISAHVHNAAGDHRVTVATGLATQSLAIAAKVEGSGSSVNGGELLMLALATCYCNDVYREAARMNIEVASVEVEALGDFDGVGLAAANVRYRARIESPASEAEVQALLDRTDAVAEVHNTVRAGVQVVREPWPGRWT
ncbi:MAG: OsmC family protein [Burkholderiaceae bacterium]